MISNDRYTPIAKYDKSLSSEFFVTNKIITGISISKSWSKEYGEITRGNKIANANMIFLLAFGDFRFLQTRKPKNAVINTMIIRQIQFHNGAKLIDITEAISAYGVD